MTDTIKIKLNIAGRYYPMSVSPEDEEAIRKAGKLINGMIKDFEKNYQTRDKQDTLAMCSLQLATKSLQVENHGFHESEEIKTHLQKLIDNIQNTI